jgi:hypothetical protein
MAALRILDMIFDLISPSHGHHPASNLSPHTVSSEIIDIERTRLIDPQGFHTFLLVLPKGYLSGFCTYTYFQSYRDAHLCMALALA